MTSRTRAGAVAVVVACVAVMEIAASARALADDNSAAVEQLFADGRKLMVAGKVADACPKFLASYNLEHRVGTLLALADCYEQNQQLASAWGRFVEATTLATRNNQVERAAYATKHAATLEPRRSMLTVNADASIAGLVVRRDGVVIDPAVYGVAVPVDRGVHTVSVTATDKVPVSESITVAVEADLKTYTVPALVSAAGPAVVVPVTTPPIAPVVVVPVETAPAATKHLSTRAMVGIGVAGAGVVMAGVGIYFGVAALGKHSDSAPYCGSDGQKDDCFGPGVGLRSDSVTDATVSSVLLGVGAAAAVAGVVLWLTAPSSRATTTVGFDGRSLRLRGTF